MLNKKILIMLSAVVVTLLISAELQYESSLELGATQAGGDKSLILADLSKDAAAIQTLISDQAFVAVRSDLRTARTNVRRGRSSLLRGDNTVAIDKVVKAISLLGLAIDKLDQIAAPNSGDPDRIDAILSDPDGGKSGLEDIVIRIQNLPSGGGTSGGGTGTTGGGATTSAFCNSRELCDGYTAIDCSNTGGGQCDAQDQAADDCRVVKDGVYQTDSPLYQCLNQGVYNCRRSNCIRSVSEETGTNNRFIAQLAEFIAIAPPTQTNPAFPTPPPCEGGAIPGNDPAYNQCITDSVANCRATVMEPSTGGSGSPKTCQQRFNDLNSCINKFQNQTSNGSCAKIGFGALGKAKINNCPSPHCAGSGKPSKSECTRVCGL